MPRSWTNPMIAALAFGVTGRKYASSVHSFPNSLPITRAPVHSLSSRIHGRQFILESTINVDTDSTGPSAAVSRRSAFVAGAGILSSMLISKDIKNPIPAASSAVLPPLPTSMLKMSLKDGIKSESSSRGTALAALSLGPAAIAAAKSSIKSSTKPTPSSTTALRSTAFAINPSERNDAGMFASSLFPKMPSSSAVRKMLNLNRIFQTTFRFFKLCGLAVPIAVWYPLAKRSPASYAKWLQFVLRQSERGGAVVIKMCQWASSRPDIFGTNFCDAFKKLQDGTTPHDWRFTEQAMKEAYGEDWEEEFAIEKEVIGSGCIAQVYKGVIKDSEGVKEPVAIKVVHPNVRKGIDNDLSLLRTLAYLLERLPFGYGEKLQWNNLSGMVEEFAKMLRPQLDLRNEAEHIKRFNKNFEGNPKVIFPKIIDKYSPQQDVLVETFCEGVPVERFCRENEDNKTLRTEMCDLAAESVCKMIFEHNFVHGDLHPGNIYITKENQMVFLDCGIANTYSEADQDTIINIITAFIRMDGRRAAELMSDDSNRRLAQTNPGEKAVDVEAYIQRIEDMSKTPRKTDFFFEKVTTYVNYIFNSAATHHVKMNPSFLSMTLAVKVQEGVALMLDPANDIIKIANPIILGAEAKRLRLGGFDRIKQLVDDTMRDMKVKADRQKTKLEEAKGNIVAEEKNIFEEAQAAL